VSRPHPFLASFPANRSTRVALPSRARVSFADLFAQIFPELNALMSGLPQDGLLIAAVLGGKTLEAHLHIPLSAPSHPEPRLDEVHFVTVGRHSACDLVLESDEAVSLRHLVIGMRPCPNGLRVRLCDLATGVGLRTEDGFGCEALTAEGAAFVSVGDYQLFLLPTGRLAPLPWAGPAASAWAAIPERIYFDRRTTSRAGRPRAVRLVPARPGRSITTQIIDPPTALRQPGSPRGPAGPGAEKKPAPGTRGPRAGTLVLTACGLVERYEVYAADLERGLLIGRYERCAFGAEDDRLSRVHLMLLRDGDQVWAVDTASSNGTTAAGASIRQVLLGARAEIDLAAAVTLRWTADEPEDRPPLSLIDAPLDDLLRSSLDPGRKRGP